MTAEELLATPQADISEVEINADITVNDQTKELEILNTITVWGVQSNNKTERIKFSCPRYVGDNQDLAAFDIFVNFKNANNVLDSYIVDDVQIEDNDMISFSWLLGRAAMYTGQTMFIIHCTQDELEWNTTLSSIQVKEGLPVTVDTDTQMDVSEFIGQLKQTLVMSSNEEQAKIKAKGDEVYSKINTTATEEEDKIKAQSDQEQAKIKAQGDKILASLPDAKEHQKIIVGTSSNAQFSDLPSAIASITDSSADKPYDILLEDGTYPILMDQTAANGFLPDYVNLIGKSGNRDKVVLLGSNPEGATSAQVTNFSVINIKANNNLENLMVVAINCRYAVNSNSYGVSTGWTQKIKNCRFVHNGNTSTSWTLCYAYYGDLSAASHREFENVQFGSQYCPVKLISILSDRTIAPAFVKFSNCQFKNLKQPLATDALCMEIDNRSQAGTSDHKVEFAHCNFGVGHLLITGQHPITVQMYGCDDIPIRAWDNSGGNNYSQNYPTTDRTIMKEYVGTTELSGGEILACSSDVNKCVLATPETPAELILGMSYGPAKPNEWVALHKGYFYVPNTTAFFGKQFYVNESGKWTLSGTYPFAICMGNFARFTC